MRTVRNLPYKDYLKAYEASHIVLDQTYALDQGYNALEAMARGKVVFTGAGEAFCKKYNLERDQVAVHTIPDAEQISANLEMLIKNPERILEIGQNAREFIEKHHESKAIAKRYVETWEQINKAKK